MQALPQIGLWYELSQAEQVQQRLRDLITRSHRFRLCRYAMMTSNRFILFVLLDVCVFISSTKAECILTVFH